MELKYRSLGKNKRKYNRYRSKRKRLPVALVEGDSWYSYPFHGNLIDVLDNAGLVATRRLELSGDTLRNMAKDEHLEKLVKELTRKKHSPQLVLLSGGGNDLLDTEREDGVPVSGFLCEAVQCQTGGIAVDDLLDPKAVDSGIDEVLVPYRKIIDTVCDSRPGIPILLHGYQHVYPSTKGVKAFGMKVTGPWLNPVLAHKGIIDPGQKKAVADRIIDSFNDKVAAMAAEYPNVRFVDFRDTPLTPSEWVDEIHPTQGGFIKLGQRLVEAVRETLDSVAAGR